MSRIADAVPHLIALSDSASLIGGAICDYPIYLHIDLRRRRGIQAGIPSRTFERLRLQVKGHRYRRYAGMGHGSPRSTVDRVNQLAGSPFNTECMPLAEIIPAQRFLYLAIIDTVRTTMQRRCRAGTIAAAVFKDVD